MSLITRTYIFTDGTVAYGSQVNSEFNTVVNALNNLDAGSLTWNNVNSLAGSFATLTMTGAIAMGAHKITGLANGSTSTDAAAFGQIPATPISVANGGTGASSGKGLLLQSLKATTASDISTSSASYVDISGLSQAITLSSSGNLVRIRMSLNLASEPASNGSCGISLLLLKDGASLKDFGQVYRISTTAGGTAIAISQVTIEFDDSPADTSAHTYKLQWKVSAGTGELNATSGTSFICTEEIGK